MLKSVREMVVTLTASTMLKCSNAPSPLFQPGTKENDAKPRISLLANSTSEDRSIDYNEQREA